jgi:hypothetical protein
MYIAFGAYMKKQSDRKNLKVTSAVLESDITDSAAIPLELERVNKNSTKRNLTTPTELITRLISEEISACAILLTIQDEELMAWVDLQIGAPLKSLLHLLRIARELTLDPLKEEVLLTQYEQIWQVSISVDGWIKLINQHPCFAGIAFTESTESNEGIPLWIECTIHRSDRVLPITTREYFCEVKNDTEIWNKMPRRMLRHRALQQCARIAMGITPPNATEKLGALPESTLSKIKTKPQQVALQENKENNCTGIEGLKIRLMT